MKTELGLLLWALSLVLQVRSTPHSKGERKSREAGCAGRCNNPGFVSCDTSRGRGQECICKLGYGGPTCSQCVEGFYTSKKNICIKCKCSYNGTKLCDKQRGTCICKDKFKGSHCEQCVSGYIRKVSPGDELLDCVTFHGAPVVSMVCGIGYQLLNSTNGGTLGYKCKRAVCECYGHSSSCVNDLGNCTYCLHNTVGQYCHRCKPGFYGDAIKGTPNDCQKCPCDIGRSTGSCHLAKSGYVTCEACKPGYSGLLCNKCANGWYGDLSISGSVCRTCNCSGNLHLDVPNSCDAVTGKCLKCTPNTTGKNCERCAAGYHRDAVGAKNCTFDELSLVKYSTASLSVKDHAVIGICSTLGLLCLCLIGFILYRKKSSSKKGHQSLWTVELSNRSYDDLDFSLLDPVSDTPFVYRMDIGEYEEDTFLPAEKSQLVMLHLDVEPEGRESKQLDTVL